jgi:hypothetical protein
MVFVHQGKKPEPVLGNEGMTSPTQQKDEEWTLCDVPRVLFNLGMRGSRVLFGRKTCSISLDQVSRLPAIVAR